MTPHALRQIAKPHANPGNDAILTQITIPDLPANMPSAGGKSDTPTQIPNLDPHPNMHSSKGQNAPTRPANGKRVNSSAHMPFH